DAKLSKASSEVVAGYFARRRPEKGGLDIGMHFHGKKKEGSRVFLKAEGFKRHTFLTGQSRSGKSFALGVILEQLLLATKLRVVVVDPNSDFVALNQILKFRKMNKFRPKSMKLSKKKYDALKAQYDKATDDLLILGEKSTDSKPLRIRFSDLSFLEKP